MASKDIMHQKWESIWKICKILTKIWYISVKLFSIKHILWFLSILNELKPKLPQTEEEIVNFLKY